MADDATPLFAWLGVGAGVILLYGAYKNKSPVAILKDALQGTVTAGTAQIQTTFAGSGTASGATPDASTATAATGGGSNPITSALAQVSTATDTARAAALKARAIKPTLVGIPGGGQLDQIAAASFGRVIAEFGAPIPNVGTFRTSAQQAAGYAASPGRFAPPGQSLHEVGLAIDVSNAVAGGVDNPRLVAAFEHNGWYRRGAIINGRNEPWHWSYAVPG